MEGKEAALKFPALLSGGSKLNLAITSTPEGTSRAWNNDLSDTYLTENNLCTDNVFFSSDTFVKNSGKSMFPFLVGGLESCLSH